MAVAPSTRPETTTRFETKAQPATVIHVDRVANALLPTMPSAQELTVATSFSGARKALLRKTVLTTLGSELRSVVWPDTMTPTVPETGRQTIVLSATRLSVSRPEPT